MSAILRGESCGGAQQVGQRGVRAAQQPLDVDRQHPLPFLQRRVDGRAEQHHAGVVDQRVQPAELVDGPLRRAPGPAPGRRRRPRSPAPCRRPSPIRCASVVEAVLAPGGDRHRRAEVGQGERGRLADAAGGARDAARPCRSVHRLSSYASDYPLVAQRKPTVVRDRGSGLDGQARRGRIDRCSRPAPGRWGCRRETARPGTGPGRGRGRARTGRRRRRRCRARRSSRRWRTASAARRSATA